MNILPFYIPFSNNSNLIGGPSSFMSNLEKYLLDRKIDWNKNIYLSQGIFFPITYNRWWLKYFKIRNLPIIQRLDGVYYPEQHGNNYLSLNKEIKDIYQNYSTHIIFQSKYSRDMCFKMLGPKNKRDYSIIVNGVDKTVFFPPKNRKSDISKFELICSGNFRKMIMLEPIILALDQLSKHYHFRLSIAGPVTEPDLQPLLNKKYIRLVGGVGHSRLSELLRHSDIFLHSQLNDNCPNSVIEAVSTALPVVGFSSGGMPELLSFNKDLLAPVNKNFFHRPEDFDSVKLAQKIKLVFDNYTLYSNIAYNNSLKYSFEECGRKYVDVLQEQIRH